MTFPSAGQQKMNLPTGLTSEQVSARFRSGQVNVQPNTNNKTTGQIVRDNVFTFFNLIIIVLAALLVVVGSFENMLFLVVAFCNTCIGIIQELRAKRILDKLSLISAVKARVIRDGQEQTLAVDQIVLGELMVLASGNQICADSLLLGGTLEVNESLLTGESETVIKNPGDHLFSGSYVVSGQAYAQAEHVGADNFAQKITAEGRKAKKHPSELRRSMNLILKLVSFLIVPMSIGLFVVQYYAADFNFSKSIISMVAAAIGMIPEGLILLTSISLALGVIQLGRRKTLVHELFCIETLARVDTLCVDKTGTLTEGKMQVGDVIPLSDAPVDHVMGNVVGALQDNNATFLALQDRFNPRNDYAILSVIPFSSERKYSGVCFHGCGTYLIGAFEFLFSQGAFPEIKAQVEQYMNQGVRVIVLAHSPMAAEGNALPPGLAPCALICLSDILRGTAQETLRYFSQQNVELVVISGDHPKTVSHIAAQAGLPGANRSIDASALRAPEEIAEAVKETRVFGRVLPSQKKDIIRALQAQGHTVAMIGDGVNDIPALKQADCSVAMAAGSDAAKSCANMVLLNSDFGAMPYAVKEGRRVINNIQSSASLYLIKTIFSFILTIIMLCIQRPYPFTPLQLTIYNMCCVGIPTFILTMEPNHRRVKAGFFRHVMRNALTGALVVVFNICVITAFAAWFHLSEEVRSTMCVLTTGMTGIYMIKHIFSLQTLLRKVVFIGMFALFFIGLMFFQNIILLVELPYQSMILMLLLCILSPYLIAGVHRLQVALASVWQKTKSKFRKKGPSKTSGKHHRHPRKT